MTFLSRHKQYPREKGFENIVCKCFPLYTLTKETQNNLLQIIWLIEAKGRIYASIQLTNIGFDYGFRLIGAKPSSEPMLP